MPAWLVGASAQSVRRQSAVSAHAHDSSASEVLAALNATLSSHAAAKQQMRSGKGAADSLRSMIEASLTGQPDQQDLPIGTAVPQVLLPASAPEVVHAAEGVSADDLARTDDMCASVHAPRLRRTSHSLPRQEDGARAEAWQHDAHHPSQSDSQQGSGLQRAGSEDIQRGLLAGPKAPAASQMQYHLTEVCHELPRTAPDAMQQRRRSSQDNRDAMGDGTLGAVRSTNNTMTAVTAVDVGAVSMQHSRLYEHAYMLQKEFVSPPHLERMQARWQHEPHLPASNPGGTAAWVSCAGKCSTG